MASARSSAVSAAWTRVSAFLDRLSAAPAFAYASVLLIQLKAIWGIWEYRDLTAGDTSAYFARASAWVESRELDPVWSPLDSVVYGSLRWVFPDAFDATVAYRVLAVLVATALVLAILRRLLPHPIAWALAVWWAILPINFDTLYEVHIFSAVPMFAAVLVALRWPGLSGRATVFGILLGATFLMRNELALAAAFWGASWLGYEVWARARGRETGSLRRVALAVAVPIVFVAAIEGLVLLRDSGDTETLGERLDAKHTLNVCQAYAFGYQQRHDDFAGSPWTDCQQLMSRDFDEPQPTLTEATRSNPGAMAGHFLWNLRLVPHGLQLLLFDGISGELNPDYPTPRVTNSATVLAASLLAVSLVVSGSILLWRERRRWWRKCVRDRMWGWIALGSLSVAALFVILTQRPRPSYLFGLSLALLALIGLCATPLLNRWPGLERMRLGLPVAAVLILLLLPTWYDRSYFTRSPGDDQALRDMVQRLEPFEDELRGAETKLLARSYPGDACLYVGGSEPCTGVALQQVIDSKPDGASTTEWLDRRGIDYVYADEVAARNPATSAFLGRLPGNGWERRAPVGAGDPPWVLLRRTSLENARRHT
jgi:hypothetical protein